MSAVRSRSSRRVIFLTKCTVARVARALKRLKNVGESLRVHCAVAPTWTHWDSEKKGAVHSIRTLLVTGTCRGATAGSPEAQAQICPRLRLLPLVLPLCTYLRYRCCRRNAESYFKSATSISPNSSCPPCSPARRCFSKALAHSSDRHVTNNTYL